MDRLTAVVLGSTGLIGSKLVDLLILDDSFSKVRLLVRQQIDKNNTKVECSKVNFQDAEQFRATIGKGDCLFCCTGTTLRQVKGDKVLYRQVDYNIPVDAARFSVENGFKKFLLVSSVGANADSSNFYLQMKGTVERDISMLPFDSIHVFQPSILLGARNEFRLGESVGKIVMQFFSVALLGSLRKYKPINAAQVARAMLIAAKSDFRGMKIWKHDEMKTAARF